MSERREAGSPGRSIIVVGFLTLGLFALTIVPDAAGLHGLDGVASGVALALFLGSLPIWFYAFGLAVLRSARGDDVRLASLFFLAGSAPGEVRRALFLVLAASVGLAIATAYGNAFAVLEPMFPLALLPLWGARHGTFPARPAPAVSR